MVWILAERQGKGKGLGTGPRGMRETRLGEGAGEETPDPGECGGTTRRRSARIMEKRPPTQENVEEPLGGAQPGTR